MNVNIDKVVISRIRLQVSSKQVSKYGEARRVVAFWLVGNRILRKRNIHIL